MALTDAAITARAESIIGDVLLSHGVRGSEQHNALIQRIVAVLCAVRDETIQNCAEIVERSYIPGHSVAGPHFTKGIADDIRSRAGGGGTR